MSKKNSGSIQYCESCFAELNNEGECKECVVPELSNRESIESIMPEYKNMFLPKDEGKTWDRVK